MSFLDLVFSVLRSMECMGVERLAELYIICFSVELEMFLTNGE